MWFAIARLAYEKTYAHVENNVYGLANILDVSLRLGKGSEVWCGSSKIKSDAEHHIAYDVPRFNNFSGKHNRILTLWVVLPTKPTPKRES